VDTLLVAVEVLGELLCVPADGVESELP
jgi:hypothetical protein